MHERASSSTGSIHCSVPLIGRASADMDAEQAAADSDNDVVTDFLNSNCCAADEGDIGAKSATQQQHHHPHHQQQQQQRCATVESQNYCIPIIKTPSSTTTSISHSNGGAGAGTGSGGGGGSGSGGNSSHNCNNNNNNNSSSSNNMIPIINVTPHSPASANKYNNIFEDTLNQLQNIRETVVQMKNSSAHVPSNYFSNYGLLQAAILSASLPDLNGEQRSGGVGGGGGGALAANASFMRSPQQYLLNADRRRSWTAVDDLTGGGDCTNKSVSLSSLDSEEQETIRVTEQRRRATRNSTGGISTHSLNEAELARDFERIVSKRNLTTEVVARIPLQKSISTSSIVAKEDIKAIQRHLTDSEDENQSLLRAHTKIEVYDNVEKRRKRGSLFFRKKKDKVKMKAAAAAAAAGNAGNQTSTCDACGLSMNLDTAQHHASECKAGKTAKSYAPRLSLGGSGGGIGGTTKRSGGDARYEPGNDLCDGSSDLQGGNYADDTPLIRSEFLNEPQIEAEDLGADPVLGITLDEFDSWSPSVPKDVLKTLKEKQIKRQEHIYEFILTEKHHCQTLFVMQKVFVESLERYFPSLDVGTMFPRLGELTELHTAFLKKLRLKQREQHVVDSIADILLDFFSLEKAQHLRLAYGEFCANYRAAQEQFKACMSGRDQPFAEWHNHCLANPLLKKKGIPECMLFVTQRLTKYPLLIEPLLKSARDDQLETDKLQHALALVKALLFDVNACVAEKELRERQIEICGRVDVKSFAIYKKKPFRKADLAVESRRRLKFEGLATLMQGRSKMQVVLVVVLTDCLCFLSENSAHNKYAFFTPEHKAGVVPLQKLLIREKAGTESRGIYIISSNPSFPEMYELKVQQPKDKNVWIQSIRQAVLECPSTDVLEADALTAEEKLRIGVNKRELIDKLRQKDIELALLLEEKIVLHFGLLKEQKRFDETTTPSATIATNNSSSSGSGNVGTNLVSAATFLSALSSYRDLVGVDCDTAELWRRVQCMVQDIGQLAASVYTAATGLPVSRSVSSVGEKHSDHYASPTLPKRAETFAGFDDRRGGGAKAHVFPCRETVGMTPRLQELEEKRELKVRPMESLPDAAAAAYLDQYMLKEHNSAALQISHHLQTLLCIISQQMTTINQLQLQLALYRESPRAAYTHNDQLEELRNLQDRLQEEKTLWLRRKEQEERDLEERRAQHIKLKEQIRLEQEDIRQQREQLYRKMELLSSQGLLLSPSTPLLVNCPPTAATLLSAGGGPVGDDSGDAGDGHEAGHILLEGGALLNASATGSSAVSTVDRRKWRSASTISKTPPVNLLSATNAPKINPSCVKQKIPMKLSSLSSPANSGGGGGGSSGGITNSTKIDKVASFKAVNAATAASSTLTQLFPLKLADKRAAATASTSQHQPTLVPAHSRTGSSPAIIQHPTSTAVTISTPSATVTRTDSLTAFNFVGAGGGGHQQQSMHQRIATKTTAKSATLPSSAAAASAAMQQAGSRKTNVKAQEEEIYF